MLKPKRERTKPEPVVDAADEEIQLERATGEGMPEPDFPASDYGASDDPDKNSG